MMEVVSGRTSDVKPLPNQYVEHDDPLWQPLKGKKLKEVALLADPAESIAVVSAAQSSAIKNVHIISNMIS